MINLENRKNIEQTTMTNEERDHLNTTRNGIIVFLIFLTICLIAAILIGWMITRL